MKGESDRKVAGVTVERPEVSLSPLTDGWPSGRACEEAPCADNAHTASFPRQPLILPASARTHTHTADPPAFLLTVKGD